MINDVRNTVLSILNKDNNGYLTPDQFNLYAKAAQLEIFEQYMHDYALASNKRTAHMYTSGNGDVAGRLAEIIDRFRYQGVPSWDGITLRYNMPKSVFKLGGLTYAVSGVEIEYIAHNKIRNLIASQDTAPTTTYPVYTIIDNEIQVYPTTITGTGNVTTTHIRYPNDPNWTYNTFVEGQPLFNPSASDYQDFEIQEDDYYNLIAKICQLAGVQIREEQVVKYMKAEENQEKQEQK